MKIEKITDAAWREAARMTATERDNAEKTGFSLAAMREIDAEMFAHLATDKKGGDR